MGISKAKKQRLKLAREGHRNPDLNRGTWGELNPLTRVTPTRMEKCQKLMSKHKKRFDHESGNGKPFLILYRDY